MSVCSGFSKARWIGFGGSVDIETEAFDLGLGLRGDPDLRSGVSHRCDTFGALSTEQFSLSWRSSISHSILRLAGAGTSGPLSSHPTFDIAALEVWATDGAFARTLKQRAAAEAGMIDKIGGRGVRAMDTEQAAMLELIGHGRLAADVPTDDGERLDKETGTDGVSNGL